MILFLINTEKTYSYSAVQGAEEVKQGVCLQPLTSSPQSVVFTPDLWPWMSLVLEFKCRPWTCHWIPRGEGEGNSTIVFCCAPALISTRSGGPEWGGGPDIRVVGQSEVGVQISEWWARVRLGSRYQISVFNYHLKQRYIFFLYGGLLDCVYLLSSSNSIGNENIRAPNLIQTHRQ